MDGIPLGFGGFNFDGTRAILWNVVFNTEGGMLHNFFVGASYEPLFEVAIIRSQLNNGPSK